MALETGDFIDDLDETYPLGSDSISQGDDHIRLIKHILKTQFPNLNEAVTVTAEDLNKGGVPVGTIMSYAGATAPAGYMLCNSTPRKRDVYADLYAVIGTTYGEGDGSTTFNVPDLTERIAAGTGPDNAPGTNAGKDLWIDEDLPAHTHAVTGGEHYHDISGSQRIGAARDTGFAHIEHKSLEDTGHTWVQSARAEGSGHTHDVADTGTGGDNRQATLYVNYIIKF